MQILHLLSFTLLIKGREGKFFILGCHATDLRQWFSSFEVFCSAAKTQIEFTAMKQQRYVGASLAEGRKMSLFSSLPLTSTDIDQMGPATTNQQIGFVRRQQKCKQLFCHQDFSSSVSNELVTEGRKEKLS